MADLKKLKLENFTCFKNNEFKFNKLNVIIGENGVGKTHLLKIIYAHLQSFKSTDKLSIELQEKILDIYFIEDVENLKRDHNNFKVDIEIDGGSINSESGKKNQLGNTIVTAKKEGVPNEMNVVFIPPQEIISSFQNYLDFKEISKYHLNSSYHYLAISLEKQYSGKCSMKEALEILNSNLKSNIILKEKAFYFEENGEQIPAQLIADGIKKLSTFKILLENNEINQNTILLIDEPEVHLNPVLIGVFVDFLIAIADKGVQIFITSHNYLLTYLISLKSEYGIYSKTSFFSLYQTKNKETIVESQPNLTKLTKNTIVEEYEKLFDIEQKYYLKMQKKNV